MLVLQSKYYSDIKTRTRNNKKIIEQNSVISMNEKVINKNWIQKQNLNSKALQKKFTVIKVASFQKFRDGSTFTNHINSIKSRIHMITSIDIDKAFDKL